MKLAYIIGNGIRSPEQLEHVAWVKKNSPHDIQTFAMSSAIKTMDSWPFYPDFYLDLETPVSENWEDLIWFYDLVVKITKIPVFLPKWVNQRLKDPPPNIIFKEIVPWDFLYKGYNPPDGVVRFNDTGQNAISLALNMGFDHIVLIGMTAWMSKEEFYRRYEGSYEKRLRQYGLGWKRVRLWTDLAFGKETLILNASTDTRIKCLPEIKLDEAIQILEGKLPCPKIEKHEYVDTL